jgi:demethoxyubiquinone hydroxylase (CLK1/Coq7/Cat5 family)
MPTLPTPRAPEPVAPAAAAPCVYYDGGCPLCRAEIATYQRTPGGDALRWVDAHGCGPAELGPGLDRQAALARMHVRRADGTVVQGAAAFVEIWSHLPRWRWLARAARWPGVLPMMELGYRAFLRLRPLWRPVAKAANDTFPRPLWRELRTDHAGETGAVMIYRGVLAVSRDPALREFARHHLETEQRHLALVEQVVPTRWRSRLLPLWRLSGWLTGALPALAGPRAVYATIQAVETFVDRHYAAQLAMIDALLAQGEGGAGPDAYASLRALLAQCQSDEIAHRDDAAGRWDGRARGLLAVWTTLVGRGSDAAVRLCRHL